jgi:hypothetical protein
MLSCSDKRIIENEKEQKKFWGVFNVKEKINKVDFNDSR